jgi:diacylglycerol kinase (ATP)
MNQSHLFIINPAAGKGKAGKNLNRLISELNKNIPEYKTELTRGKLHAAELAREAASAGIRNIIAVGGDGTINEVVSGIIRSGKDVNFGIIPEGGGNDLARNFRISSNVKKAVKLIRRKKLIQIDAGKIEDHYFINSFGIGLDAKVAEYASKAKVLNGLPRYIFAVLKALVKMKPYKINLTLNEMNISSEFTMVSIGNGKYCGGGFMLTPNALADDGLFDICLIDKVNRRKILKLLPSAIKGKHITQPEATLKRANKIRVQTADKIPIYFDGEIPNLKNPNDFTIELLPKRINLIC